MTSLSQEIVAGYVIGAVLLLVTVTVSAVLIRRSRRKEARRTRRRVTWHGNVPRPGQSLHRERWVL